MYPHPRLSAALVAAGLLLCGGPALADGRASATISNLQFGVLDLTPDDGIAAGYSIASVAGPMLGTNINSRGGIRLWEDLSPAPYEPGTARVDDGATFAQASTEGGLGDISAAAYATPSVVRFGDAHVGSRVNQMIELTVQPHTVLIMSGHLHVLSAYALDGARYLSIASASVSFLSDGVSASESHSTVTNWNTDTTDEWDKDFMLAYANGSDDDLAVRFYLATWTSMSVTPPIPEPEMWTMLGAGMLLLGAAGRYRRR